MKEGELFDTIDDSLNGVGRFNCIGRFVDVFKCATRNDTCLTIDRSCGQSVRQIRSVLRKANIRTWNVLYSESFITLSIDAKNYVEAIQILTSKYHSITAW